MKGETGASLTVTGAEGGIMWSLKVLIRIFPGIVVACICMSSSFSQIPNLQDYVDDTLATVPELAQITGSPSLTTSINDAVFGFPLLDDYEPEAVRELSAAPRSPSGAFLLEPGAYEGKVHSYCLKPGTHGPGGGAGYLYGALRGPYADIVETILRGSSQDTDISHGQIQMLLWAVISRAGLKGISPDLQLVASRLLSWEQMYRLNGGALAFIPKSRLDRYLGGLPKTIMNSFRAEATIREMLNRGDVSYSDLERVAILAGAPSPNLSGPKVPKNRWSVHPSGYLVRYFPEKVSRTRIQVWVPRHVTTRLDPMGRIVSLHDNWGNQLSFDYEDKEGLLPPPPSSNLRVAALNHLRWSRFEGSGRVTETLIFRGESSWTWFRPTEVGVDISGRSPAATASGSWKDRYREAVERGQELERFAAGLPSECRKLAYVQAKLSNLVHLHNTLKVVMRRNDAVTLASMALLSDGLAGEVGRQVWGRERGRLAKFVEFDPASEVAVPANTGRQRLGLSARLH
jgi:hypothetical protein